MNSNIEFFNSFIDKAIIVGYYENSCYTYCLNFCLYDLLYIQIRNPLLNHLQPKNSLEDNETFFYGERCKSVQKY